MEFENMLPVEVRGTEEYRSAFLKALQNKPLTDKEKRSYEMATTDVAGVIPTLTQERIFNKLKLNSAAYERDHSCRFLAM